MSRGYNHTVYGKSTNREYLGINRVFKNIGMQMKELEKTLEAYSEALDSSDDAMQMDMLRRELIRIRRNWNRTDELVDSEKYMSRIQKKEEILNKQAWDREILGCYEEQAVSYDSGDVDEALKEA